MQQNRRKEIEFSRSFLPPANVVCEGYVFTGVCLSTGGGVLSQHALQVVSQHALQQVSRGCGIPACLAGFQANTQGGSLGESGLGGLQAHTQGGSWGGSGWGVPAPGGVETPQDGYCCGWYTSYWNAFLFQVIFFQVISGRIWQMNDVDEWVQITVPDLYLIDFTFVHFSFKIAYCHCGWPDSFRLW